MTETVEGRWGTATPTLYGTPYSTYTVVTNTIGEVVLSDLSAGSQHWYTSQQYDDAGRLLALAMPSAIADATANSNGTITLTAPESGLPQGLVYTSSYFDSSSETAGYLWQTGLKNGLNAGTTVIQAE